MTTPLLQRVTVHRRTAALGLVLVAAAVGCQRGLYRPSKLPPEWRVAKSTRQQEINIEQMSGPGDRASLIASGDVLAVTIATGRDNERPLPYASRVADDGTIDVPLVGPVIVANLEPFEASRAIASASVERGIFLRPHVSLEVKAKATNRITVLGAVVKPGTHELPRNSSDLLAALGAAGGLTKEAGAEVEILRQASPTFLAGADAAPADLEVVQTAYADLNTGIDPPPPPGDKPSQDMGSELASRGVPAPGAQTNGPQLLRVDLARAANQIGRDYRLDDRDVVMVKPRDKQLIHVTGLVHKPGQFELPSDQDVRLLDAIAMAGGCNSPVGDKVFIIRRVPDRAEPVVIQASVSRAKRAGEENLMLTAGDLVSIEQTPSTVVVDGVLRFFRVAVSVAGSAPLF